MYKLQVFEVYAHGLPIILETEKTSFLQDIAEKLQKVLLVFLPVHMGPRINLLGRKSVGNRVTVTVTLSL